MLRALLKYAHEDAGVTALAEAARAEPQRAFVSASLRPYLLATLLDAEPERPALVVAGDDRAARDLAADLKAFLEPAAGALLPGARHALRVAPGAAAAPGRPAHRGARRAARRAAGGAWSRRPSRWPRRCPTPTCARTASRSRRAGCSTSTRCPAAARGLRLRARRPGRGARPVRRARRHPRRLPRHRGARGALRAVRRRGRAAHLVLHLHPALARGGRAGRDRAGRRARPRAPRAGRDRGLRARTASAPTSPTCCPWTASASCSTSSRTRRSWWWQPRRSWRRRCATSGTT